MDKLDLDAIARALEAGTFYDSALGRYRDAKEALERLRAALPVEEKGPRPVEAETVANQISDARNTYIEGFMAGWGDNVNQDVLILAMKAWDSSESRAEVEAASRPQEEGKAEPRPGGLRSIEQVEVMTGGVKGVGISLILNGTEEIALTCREAMRIARDLEEASQEQLGSDQYDRIFRELEDEPFGPIKLEAVQAPTAQSAPPLAGPESPPVEPDLFDLVHQVHEAMKRGGWKSFHAHGLAVTPTEAHGPLVSDFPAPPMEPPAPRPMVDYATPCQCGHVMADHNHAKGRCNYFTCGCRGFEAQAGEAP